MEAIDVTALQEEHLKKITLEKKLITVKECHDLTGIGERKLRELCNTSGFPCMKFGRKCMIASSLIDEWIKNNIGKTF